MKLMDFVILAVVAAIVGAVVYYLHRARKKGIKCIGCPDGAKCSGSCAGCSGQCSSSGKP